MPLHKAIDGEHYTNTVVHSDNEQILFDSANIHVLRHETHGKFAAEEARVLRGLRPQAIDLPIAPFTTTRFFGSKRKQLNWIAAELRQFKGVTALDAFGGTGTVTHALATAGWNVTYNDIFEFNCICARAIFSTPADALEESEIEEILARVKPLPGFIYSTFDGIFFLPQENAWLDGFLHQISDITGPRRDVLLYCLFQACLMKRPFNLFHRANLNVGSPGTELEFAL